MISAAALVMVAVFGAFALNGSRVLELFGVMMATAVFLDAFVIRMILCRRSSSGSAAAPGRSPRSVDRRLPRLALEPQADAPAGAGTDPRLRGSGMTTSSDQDEGSVMPGQTAAVGGYARRLAAPSPAPGHARSGDAPAALFILTSTVKSTSVIRAGLLLAAGAAPSRRLLLANSDQSRIEGPFRNALALMIKPIPFGWGIYLTDGPESALASAGLIRSGARCATSPTPRSPCTTGLSAGRRCGSAPTRGPLAPPGRTGECRSRM